MCVCVRVWVRTCVHIHGSGLCINVMLVCLCMYTVEVYSVGVLGNRREIYPQDLYVFVHLQIEFQPTEFPLTWQTNKVIVFILLSQGSNV